MRRLLLSLILVAPSIASADHKDCSSVYTPQEFRGAISQAEEALGNVDMNGAVTLLTEAGQRILCLDSPVESSDIARFARDLSVLAFYGQDEFASTKYGNLARLADPNIASLKGMGPDHPYNVLMNEEELPPIGGPDDPSLEYPRGGAFYMNGKKVTEARAYAEVPMFVQVFDEHDVVIDAFWQDGAAFAPKYLPGGGGAGLGFNPVLAVAGIGGVGVGAALYLAAAGSAGGMKNAETAEQLTSIRSTTNMLVMASGGAAVAGLGVGASAFVLDGGAGVGLRVRW